MDKKKIGSLSATVENGRKNTICATLATFHFNGNSILYTTIYSDETQFIDSVIIEKK